MTTGYRVENNTLLLWGNNTDGQLGVNNVVHRSLPIQELTSSTNWKVASAGGYHTAVIKTDNSLWLWGRNDNGQLGDNTNSIHRSSPVQTVSGGTNWKMVFVGKDHTVAIKTDGTLWSWGRNAAGYLGDNSTIDKSSPVQTVAGGTNWKIASAGSYYTSTIKDDGTLWVWGSNFFGTLGDNSTIDKSSPTQIGTNTNWQIVSAGGFQTAAIKTDGTLWTWGHNNNGQIGDGSIIHRSSPTQVGTNTNWQTVSAGNQYVAAIKRDGTLWGWGRNSNGQLGDNSITHRSSPVQELSGSTNWKEISCGQVHSVALKTDDTLWSWGNNTYGQLDDNTVANKSSPVQDSTNSTDWKMISTGEFHTVALKRNRRDFDDKYIRKSLFEAGNMFSWGDNTQGQLGINDVTHRSSPIQTIAGGGNWKTAGLGWWSTSAIKTDGRLWSMGLNGDGQLGDGTRVKKSSPVAIGSLQNWKTVTVGSYFALATKTDGTAWSWGWNGNGMLGQNDIVHRSSPTIIGSNTNWKITSAGYYHSAGIKNDGTLWTWGKNHVGALGVNDLTHRSSPAQVGSLTNWKDVSAGGYFTAFLNNSGQIWATGNGLAGQLGNNSSVTQSSPVQEITNSTDWKRISAAGFHMIAIKNNGSLWTWGRNNFGQLGDSSIVSKSSPVQTISGGTNWKLIAGGDYNTYSIKSDGTLWAWGNGAIGRLGDGTTVSKSSPVQLSTATDWISLGIGGYSGFRLVE